VGGATNSAPAVSRSWVLDSASATLDDYWGLSATMYHLGWGLRQFGRLEHGARALEEAIDVGRAAGMWNTVQWALADLAIGKVHQGQLEAARRTFEEASAASREVGDGAGEILAGYGFGLLAHVAEDWQSARGHYAEAVEGFVSLGTPVMEGVSLAALGRCEEAEGDAEGAQMCYEQALTIGRRLAELSVTASALEGLGRLAFTAGREEEAERLLGEAREVRERAHRPAPPHERRDLDSVIAS
jgi:tetratricopeptide (TPR) repeat protein